MRALDRRSFLAGTLAAGATATLAACGYRGDDTGEGTAWRYTDDRDKQINLPKRPERVVAQITPAAALWDFGIEPVGIFGPSRLPGGKQDPQSGSIELDKTTSLGNVWGEFNYDKFVSLNPDLLVSVTYVDNELWYVPTEQTADVAKAAPTLAVDLAERDMKQATQEFEKLAGRLGADLEAERVTSAKRRFTKAEEEFTKVAKETSNLRVLAMSAQQDLLHVGTPAAFPTTRYYAERGMNFVKPDNVAPKDYFAELSWENADRYEADVLFYDDRFSSLKPKDLTDNPTWSRLPAVRAGRLIPWTSEPPLSYAALAEVLETLTENLKEAAARS
ncbi:iron complex transport system substrate-binding protein [Tamaricihabitans halophyticus]|uniref:Iron complex transport system substrate-binding protein n=1 Tax=Tamaricihabitans halophyticus TaxID=1262583 RepID=A0A4R2R3C2_9PSEU|nr:ABC transporter substrate-binding protein [Tamaricihabitans halophyticus]TCP57312.1 iron complex transport system substrate-binding protein [Tamaricihabitans halophyticus]